MRRLLWVAAVAVACALVPAKSFAETIAPGAPGASANWTTGNKQGLGTAVERKSKVWYTLSGGALSEVYYPSGDTANVRSMEFAVTDGRTFVDRESEDTTQKVRLADRRALIYTQINTATSGRYRIVKTYVTDPARASVLMRVTFQPLVPGAYRLFALYDPAVDNSSRGDSASRRGIRRNVSLVTTDGGTASALVASSGFTRTSSGFVSTSDGWTDLQDRHLDWDYDSAPDGNVMQTGEILLHDDKETTFTLALGFGGTAAEADRVARASLARQFKAHAASYKNGWRKYLRSLRRAPRALSGRLETQYDVSVMTVKAHEDKTYPGAFIASLTLPWGFAVNADSGGGGYHFVWARDLYQQASAMLAAGDRAAANRTVTWLFTRQQLPDGTFPQNSKVDGTPDQRNLQLDEVAFPIVLAWQLGRTDDATFAGVRKAANALVAKGPSTPQERWEETGGYSPSTIAAEIAALAAAADLARQRGDQRHASIWNGVADAWQRSTEKWMFTTNGPVGDGRYYVRIDDDGDPNDGSERDFANRAGVHKENAVLDAGFLDLVRLGVKAPEDPYVAGSLAETDASIATDTPSGRVWHRYTFDGYGEKANGDPWDFGGGTIGRAWPLLGGERGEYVVARGGNGLPYLRTMANTANDGYMIPEQVWDQPEPAPEPYNYQPGKATGSASPLAWAMAQYVRLARAIDAGKPVETPAAVAARYATGAQRDVPALEVTSPEDGSVSDSREATVRGTTDGARVYVSVGDHIEEADTADGAFAATVPLERGGNAITVVAVGEDGGTNMRQITVVAFGTRIGGFADPTGDDNGPGTYVYPTNSAFAPGGFDIRGLDVFTDQDQVLFVTRIAGEIRNPWGGDQISHQRINVYLGAGDGSAAPALPGTNMDTAAPWRAVVVGDGRFDTAGLYAPDGRKLSDVQLLAVPQTRQIAVVVPRSALAGLDPATARYGTAMFGNGEAGEGIGYIRPVYDYDYWNNPPEGMGWVKEYRFGGGAGQIDFSLDSKDTDTRDPNSIDVIVGDGQSQSAVLDWRAGSPVKLPMLALGP